MDRYSMDKHSLSEIKQTVDRAVTKGTDLVLHAHHSV